VNNKAFFSKKKRNLSGQIYGDAGPEEPNIKSVLAGYRRSTVGSGDRTAERSWQVQRVVLRSFVHTLNAVNRIFFSFFYVSIVEI
jgi:hypothetical protein